MLDKEQRRWGEVKVCLVDTESDTQLTNQGMMERAGNIKDNFWGLGASETAHG